MVEIKMTKSKYFTSGWMSLYKPVLVQWDCEALVNSEVIKQSYIGHTKRVARANFIKLINGRRERWLEYLAK
ncbi:hypothetical protein UFOVP753_53 [uncultured Caudovirales phage]|uniref:Uncharacterized protein n=1 Tax=uncultured Caudovirales phage TaxID=2100421 RepID=A0A6J7X8U7_9CAUD|nr:hypothetical protein UFOVP753_53 [uncultured Caudovirales phage]